MNIRTWSKTLHSCVLALFSSSSVLAQEKPLEISQSDWVAPWIVTIKDQERVLLLRINNITRKDDRSADLDAEFNWLDSKGRPVVGQVLQTDQGPQLLFVTASGNRYKAVQSAVGRFDGGYTDASGNSKLATIERITEDSLKERIEYIRPTIIKPGPNVPSACAAFSGEWFGTWSVANTGTGTLRVYEVSEKCVAKFISSGNIRLEVEIKDGSLTFLCNRSTQGTCIFTVHGDDLWASYSNISGGRNNAVYKRRN
ncbi:MAG: hypothetical protein U1E84_12510 [Rhodoferax sp.]